MAWISPTGFNDPDSKWNNETQAYDGDIGTGADSPNDTSRTWGSYLELNIVEINCDKIRYYANYVGPQGINEIDIDLYYDSAWNDLYEGSFADRAWEEKAIGSTKNVTKARIRFYAKKADTAYLYEFEFNEIVSGLINGYFMQDGAKEEKLGYFMNAIEEFGYYMNGKEV